MRGINEKKRGKCTGRKARSGWKDKTWCRKTGRGFQEKKGKALPLQHEDITSYSN